MQQPSRSLAEYEHHEAIFLERYVWLLGWALQLTEHDRQRAEDLVHDAYIQFTLTRPDLNAISNLNGYLYVMLRNLQRSHMRRSLRMQHRTLSIIDYDSAEVGLRGTDPSEQLRVQESLRQVCQYACIRKRTSKAGSVLILRFLHGYYPREIAQVMRSTREAVEERLRTARNEARQYLVNPKGLRFMCEQASPMPELNRMRLMSTVDELLNELREAIFNSRQGDCLTPKQLQDLYRGNETSRMDCMTLGHIVSCRHCLDEVNRSLNLPLLSERFTTETVDSETGPKDGDNGSIGGTTGGGGPSDSELLRCRKRARDVLEHKPAELCISINGFLMAGQKVSSELSEQSLNLPVNERIHFVEIFSEQDVRLLFFSVEHLPKGSKRQAARVELSDHRTLEATLKFDEPAPILKVVYHDPSMGDAREQLNVTEESILTLAPAANAPEKKRTRRRFLNHMRRLWRGVINADRWPRPGPVTALVSIVLLVALWLSRVPVPVASASELLRRSAEAEDTIARNPDTVLHRTINLEERRRNGGGLIRRRIEVWQSAAQGIKLRRIYDEQAGLIAGEWTRADGTSTVYRRGSEPQSRTAPYVSGQAVLETGELWRLDPSPRDFNILVPRPEAVTVEETSNTYVLSYRSDELTNAGRLVNAKLTLNKTDLHALEQAITVRSDGEEREYVFTETVFEQKPSVTVTPDLFQPEPELLGVDERMKGGVDKANQSTADSLKAAPNAAKAVASAELEIEVTYLLNQIKANLGEQVSLTRTTGGTLQVDALAETESRKIEILRALAPIIRNPAVTIEVRTVAEAIERQPRSAKPRELTVREVEVANNRIPADTEVRAYFSARLMGDEAIDDEIKRYGNRVLDHSRKALLKASALSRLVRQFSSEDIRTVTPEARSKWLAMISEHAKGYQREIAALRQELRPVFTGPNASPAETISEANLVQLSDRLLQLSYTNDEAVRSAFTISADGRTAAAIKSLQFWRSLATTEQLAAAIQNRYQQ